MAKNKEKKEAKKKPLYSTPANIVFLMKKAWGMDKVLLFSTVVRMPVLVLIPLLGTYLSKYLVELISTGAAESRLIFCVLGFSAALLLLQLTDNYIGANITWRSFGNRFKYLALYGQKTMDMDYDNLENPDVQTKNQKAFNSVSGNAQGTQQVFSELVSIISCGISLITYSALIFSLSPWIVLLLVSLTVANYNLNKANNGWYHRNKDNWVPIDRKMGYIQRKAGDFEAAKDVRLYGISEWFGDLFEKFLGQRLVWTKKGEKRNFAIDVCSGVITFIRDGATYGFLIYSVVKGNTSVADFVFYFGLISQYSGWLLGLIGAYNSLEQTSLSFCDFREFYEYPDTFNHGKGCALPEEAPEILFENVTFRYPGSDEDALKDLSFRIKKGEKIALVGLNGAGKTTLVKLLCGLYSPSSGSIRVNGHDIREYNRDEYYRILSVVFQDICLLPVSVAKNISLCEQRRIDADRLSSALKLSGLYEKVCLLPQKEATMLMKSINDEATDLSGGEKQKLALARAIYKGGYIMVLDEPTAALDPIAENRIYQQYNELTQSATSVFISHRLSSTRFCDRILFLEKGKILEEGSHFELMELGGKYADLFEIQSHYYKEGKEENE